MPATRLTMRKIREVLHLFFDCHLTKRQIAKSCAIARSTVSEYLRRFAASGLSWPVSSETHATKLEGGVLVVERWILARIRNETFFSLAQLNQRIGELLEALNQRPFQKLPGTRYSVFLEIDRPALKPLPAQPVGGGGK